MPVPKGIRPVLSKHRIEVQQTKDFGSGVPDSPLQIEYSHVEVKYCPEVDDSLAQRACRRFFSFLFSLFTLN